MGSKWKSLDCSHDEATRVFKVGKTPIWAGSQEELLERFGWALVISAIGYSKFGECPLSGNESAKGLLPAALFAWEPPPCIGIKWPDYGVPTVSAEWWDKLATALRSVKGDIGLCCQGGHGRTGTMLAILAVKLGRVKKGDCPVAWVRARYCKKAVESTAQLDYIERVTGVTVFSEGSSSSVTALPLGKGSTYSYPGQAVANPTQASPKPPLSAIGAGSGAGVLNREAGDEELLEAWFKAEDGVAVAGPDGETQHLSPVWDKDGELVGWEGV